MTDTQISRGFMVQHRRVEELIAQLIARPKPKAKSIIITVYGDSIAHHGGCAWLGSLIKLVEPLGLNERVVRTSVLRLAKEGWLVADQIGRRSYYRLTELGRHRFDAAHGRIYHHEIKPWDGRWMLVSTSLVTMSQERREALRHDLRWLGFGQLASGVMLHPSPDESAVRQALVDAGVSRDALVMHAYVDSWAGPKVLRDLINTCWDMKQVAAGYVEFLETFRPVWKALHGAEELDPRQCFVIRTLLMHGFRRVLLRDPKLPDELMEAEWPGAPARQLCRNLFSLVQAAAERHLMAELETMEGAAPEAHPSYYQRFGGLSD